MLEAFESFNGRGGRRERAGGDQATASDQRIVEASGDVTSDPSQHEAGDGV